jgi:hypothetical protein
LENKIRTNNNDILNDLPSNENLMKDLFYVFPEEKEYLDKMEAYIQN